MLGGRETASVVGVNSPSVWPPLAGGWQVEPNMAPLTQRGVGFAGPLRATARLGLFALLATTLSGVALTRAQPPGDPPAKLYYSRGLTFLIPFSVDARGVVRVHLSVSEDRGKTYRKVASAAPTEQNFRYTAGGDGLYWFATQVEMQDGKLYPETIV